MIKTTCLSTTAAILKSGGVGLLPFDTIWGLTGIPDLSVIQKIQRLKQRPEGMPFILLANHISDLAPYLAFIPPEIQDFMDTVWPGPTTLLLPKSSACPDSLTQGKPTLGLRIPDNDVVQALIQHVGQPILSTSVNVSGEAPALTKAQFNPEIVAGCDVILDLDDPPLKAPSAIYDCSQFPFKKIR